MKFLLGSLLIAVASLTTTALSSGSTGSTKNFFNPAAAGPYPVGVTTTVFVDHKRIDAATKEDRTLVTEIWYPATDETRNLPKNKFSDFLPGGPTPQLESLIETAFKKPLAEVDR
ncbi:MAG: hypothetical protein J2P31_09305, partial [Blastocatellia bacterium]|nr:hypothetical protein [Blastocatellia bacterium]